MGQVAFSVNNAAASSITFNPSILLKDGSQYLDVTSSLTNPRLAVIKHTIPDVRQAKASDRHYVQFTKTSFDATSNPFTASVAISVVIPRSVITTADIADLRAFAKNFIGTDAIWNSLVQGGY